MAREMKDSGIEWIGNIPDSWSVCRLRFLCDIATGNQDTQDNDPDGIYPFYVRSPIIEHSNSYTFEGEAILMAGDGVGAGKVFHYVDGKYGCHQRVYSIQHIKGISRRLLYYYLQNRFYVSIETANSKSTVDSVRLNMLQDFPVLVPETKEQCKIVSFLDTECDRIDSVIEQTRASIEEYKKLKQAVITQAVTKGIRPNRPMKDSGIEWIGEIPNDWDILSLGAVTENMRNGYVGPTKDIFCDEGVRYIQSLHIKDGKIDFSRKEYYVSEEWAQLHPKIKTNDVLIVQTGEIGNVGLVTKDYNECNCHALIIATPRENVVFPEFLTYYLRSTVGKELLLNYKTGALLPHLNTGKIKFTAVCIPKLKEQKEIVHYLDSTMSKMDNIIGKKQCVLSELEKYKKALIFDYVTGKKEVQ